MRQLCFMVCLITFAIQVHAGGGASYTPNCKSYTKSSNTSQWPDNQPCPDDGVVADLFACGYKNKWDRQGLSEAEANRANYCMFQKGYHYRGWPEGRATCERQPDALGCDKVITRPKGGVN
jgi:hypothetical protein